LATDPCANDLAGLATMHERLVKDAPAWYDRVEVDYLSATALANFRTGSRPAARISPGEPFHPIQIDHRWVTDWYHVLISGVTLHSPPPQQFIRVRRWPSLPSLQLVAKSAYILGRLLPGAYLGSGLT